jgi:hypothetical protein
VKTIELFTRGHHYGFRVYIAGKLHFEGEVSTSEAIAHEAAADWLNAQALELWVREEGI